ncbi:MAG TPA: acetyl-CoA carboxylase biotin carboxyl carrier protein [Candidatus Marinimicrobia bacterium]|jgi:acetyl-CoA carboxylase biotin carboxyl carrier protein|nr:MAG: acetyl-CoA carboxylase, biotin carboxyl carrier protein [Candidatus Neomarinimicrobiota bacterium]HIA28701.1 acetyl-CoA carboxylase biotin carboxyl carrier protein [Candidatus Neomarinimicrobiota bacterium]HIA85677.1 acetyl-CoA carboxylase biotin carboxyl carrier protein [Candidatus Neomarinimicrobiota bacterium]HIB58000.1 acetyl-CoA carboxylase biotin carboxyl carrier protein [Candidatus Neomarinimicrobiota bacterium]HIC51864.1 acetyl-CoA carboxylase biotin carboxyl carrier protein [Ca
MNWQARLQRLIEILETSEINEIEVGFWGRKFRVSKTVSPTVVTSGNREVQTVTVQETEVSDPTSASKPEEDETVTELVEEETVEVTAPMVGTYYSAPTPDAEVFVKVGDNVTTGQTLCIIEAMKIMNEIEAETTGSIKKILVENAQPVEFGQSLFVILPH